MARWLRPGLMGGVFGTYVPSGGGGGGTGPTLPTLTTSGLVLQQRFYADAPTGQLYKDNGLTQQAASGDTILGIKDISGSANNIVDTQPGAGSVLTANQINGKRALVFNGVSSILETRASGYLSTLRSAQNITIFIIGVITGSNSTATYLMSMKSRAANNFSDPDSLFLRLGASGGYMTGGRTGGGGAGNGGFPLLTYSTDVNASWSDYYGKRVKIVLRACTGTSQIQRLNIAGTDGTNAGTHTTTYTNVVSDADGGSAAWDVLDYGGAYYNGSVVYFSGINILETDVWTGPTQMSDADVASLMSYGTTQAGF